jgi:hypothetical protein
LVGHVLQPDATASAGRITVSDSDGHAVAEIEHAAGLDSFHPPLAARSYALHMRGQPAETEGYYAIDLVVMQDNPPELLEASNGAKSGAEPLVFEGSGRLRAFTLSRLPPGDVDYYALDVEEGAVAYATCEGESAGSGVRELRAELRDATDAVLLSATETATANLRTDLFTFAKAGTYYLRLSSGTSEAEQAVEPWVRCSITMAPP